jgi:hypothetical protein
MSTHRTIYGIASTRAFLDECVRYVPLHEHTLTPLVWSYASTLTRMIFFCRNMFYKRVGHTVSVRVMRGFA